MAKLTTKIARIVARNVRPALFDWAAEMEADYTFLGSLDGEELWVSPAGEFLRQTGPEEHQHGSLGEACPEGTPYSLAAKLAARKGGTHAYKTVVRTHLGSLWHGLDLDEDDLAERQADWEADNQDILARRAAQASYYRRGF